MKTAEIEALNEGKTSLQNESNGLNLLEISNNDTRKSTFLSRENEETFKNRRDQEINVSIPLNDSKSEALPEFKALTLESHKTGIDGVWASIKDTFSSLFSERDTLHNHTRNLARAGMTEPERNQLAVEQQEVRKNNQNSGEGIWKGSFTLFSKTPMLDELDRRTIALEKIISQSAKTNMTPLEVAQLESDNASSTIKAQYAKQLIAIVSRYESNGSVPTDVYQNILMPPVQLNREDKRNTTKPTSLGQTLPDFRIDFDSLDLKR